MNWCFSANYFLEGVHYILFNNTRRLKENLLKFVEILDSMVTFCSRISAQNGALRLTLIEIRPILVYTVLYKLIRRFVLIPGIEFEFSLLRPYRIVFKRFNTFRCKTLLFIELKLLENDL